MKHQSHLLDCHSKTLKALQSHWVGGCGSMFYHPPESNAQCQSKGPEEFRSKEMCLSLPHPVLLNIRNQRTCLVDITRDCSSALRFYNINLGKLSSEGRWPGCSRRKSVGSEVVHIKDWSEGDRG